MVKKTVAVIGETGDFCPALAKAAVQQDLRLLFISRDEDKNSALKEQLGQLEQTAEVEFLSCEKEGCWEADVIAFTRPREIEAALLERIALVSTQKIVLVISGEAKQEDKEELCFQNLLPHSKVVELELNHQEFRIFGKNTEANESVQTFLKSAGYHQKQ